MCLRAVSPSALRPSRDRQGLVAAALTSFSFPKSADFRAYLLQVLAAFQRSPSRLEAAPTRGAGGAARGQEAVPPHCQGFPTPSLPGDGHPGGFEGAGSPPNPSAPFPGKAASQPAPPPGAHLSPPSSSSSPHPSSGALPHLCGDTHPAPPSFPTAPNFSHQYFAPRFYLRGMFGARAPSQPRVVPCHVQPLTPSGHWDVPVAVPYTSLAPWGHL